MGYFAGVGLGSTLFPGVLWAKLAAGAEITVDTIASAEEVAGVHFDPGERELSNPGDRWSEAKSLIAPYPPTSMSSRFCR